MRKKIFSALMLVAFFAATSSTLVSCKDYDEEISAVNTRIDNLDEELSADIAALETQLNTTKTQLQAAIDANEDAIAALAAEHDADVEALEAKIASNNQKIVDLTARVAVLESAMTEAQTAIKNLQDTKADKSALEAAIADAAATHAALSGDIKALQQADKDIIAAYKAADDALESKITAAYEAADKELAAAFAAADQNLQLQINANKAAIEALQKFQTEQLANNDAQQTAIGKNASDIATLAQKEANDIKALNDALTEYKAKVADTYATKKELADGLQKASDDINAVNDKVNIINVLISKRLTSIVFAPNKYIDGVECIDFASIKYKSWGDAKIEKKAEKDPFLRDYPTDGKYSGDNYYDGSSADRALPDSFLIDDGTATATYYVNPSGVKKDNIASMEYIHQYGVTNYLTRADNVKDDVKLVVKGWEIENGKMTVSFTKNVDQTKNQNQINNGNQNFTIVALKAEIAKEQLTEGEESAVVYSDWARLSETTSKVRIHQKGANEANDADAHFYAFSEIYTQFASTNNGSSEAVHFKYPSANAAGTIVKNVKYNETLNLNSLDDVCDTEGNTVDYKSYGLKFEHNLVEYNVLNEQNTDDWTNQAKYAKITVDENGNDILSSCAADGTITNGKNRDAIGKTPVIQVVLKDTVNNQVVDVRFYRIMWTIVNPEARTYNELTFDFAWECGGVYGSRIQEAELNKFYAWAAEDGNGYDQITFHSLFQIDENLYSSVDGAKKQDRTKVIGTVKDQYSAQQSTQAHNITFDFTDSEPLTAELYNGTPVVRTAYIVYRANAGSYEYPAFIIPVKATITYKGKKIEAAAKYNQSAWNFQGGSSTAYSLDNIKKYVSSNPTLTNNPLYGTTAGFTDAQFINDLLNNYTINGAAPTTVDELLKNQDEAKLIFDKDRLDILPGEAKWSVSADGQTLYYKENIIAAKIVNNKVQLYEANAGNGGIPSEAALLFVNYTADETTDVNTIKNAVPVKLVGTLCNYTRDLDKYLVRFEKPLTPITTNVNLEVIDQITTTNIAGTNEDGSVASPAISGLFGLKEAFGQYRTVVGDGAVAGLKKWYIVGDPDYSDLANAKTNYQKDGSIGTTCNVPVTDIKDSQGNQYWQIALITCADGQLHFQFKNQNGNALQQPIKIQFDVVLQTKWLRDIKYTVTVTVKPNTNPGGAK